MMWQIEGLDWDLEVGILGVNAADLERGNANISAGRDLPWLQDTAGDAVWQDWNVTQRDVVILDENNLPVAIFNLTTNSLSDPANYEALLALLEAAANP